MKERWEEEEDSFSKGDEINRIWRKRIREISNSSLSIISLFYTFKWHVKN